MLPGHGLGRGMGAGNDVGSEFLVPALGALLQQDGAVCVYPWGTWLTLRLGGCPVARGEKAGSFGIPDMALQQVC